MQFSLRRFLLMSRRNQLEWGVLGISQVYFLLQFQHNNSERRGQYNPHYHHIRSSINDAAFFLGDLFDGAKILTPSEYEAELKRWNWVFASPRIPKLYNVSGNHDIGYRVPHIQEELVRRYVRNFGPLNYTVKLNGITFVIISALTLEDQETPPELVKQTRDFIQSLDAKEIAPAVLLTHVPLWRPEETKCGILNAYGPLIDRVGYSYTNLLPKSISNRLLEKIKPIHVFSGDNHDHCHYVHPQGYPEYTLGTFSWMQGVPVPSFAAITVISGPSSPAPVFSVQICFLPNQLRIYGFYAGLLLVTWGLLLPIALQELLRQDHHKYELPRLSPSNKGGGGSVLRSLSYLLKKGRKKKTIIYCLRYLAKRTAAILPLVLPFYVFLIWIET